MFGEIWCVTWRIPGGDQEVGVGGRPTLLHLERSRDQAGTYFHFPLVGFSLSRSTNPGRGRYFDPKP